MVCHEPREWVEICWGAEVGRRQPGSLPAPHIHCFDSTRAQFGIDGSQATCVPDGADSPFSSILRRIVTPFLFVSASASGVAGRPSPSASLILYVSLLLNFSKFCSCG